MDDALGLIVGILVAVVVAAVVGFRVAKSRKGLPGPSVAPELSVPSAPPSLADRLAKSRDALGGRLRAAFSRENLDDEFWDDLEDALVASDVGVAVSTEIVAAVRKTKPESPADGRTALRSELLAVLSGQDRAINRSNTPAVLVVVGVNGVGKTTTIAKLAARLREDGLESLLGAADTFRAAADTQLRTWAERVGTDIVSAEPGSDPASVAFDAYSAAKSRGKDVCIIDTAGRLHSKQNLMSELGKIVRVLEREAGSLDEVLLVLDATTGQNGVAQTKEFSNVVDISGIVLTKMDGTARGGIAIAVEKELGVPVKFIGVGEGLDDLIRFEPEAFVDALLAGI